jgi:hypothetical protein
MFFFVFRQKILRKHSKFFFRVRNKSLECLQNILRKRDICAMEIKMHCDGEIKPSDQVILLFFITKMLACKKELKDRKQFNNRICSWQYSLIFLPFCLLQMLKAQLLITKCICSNNSI